MKKIGSIFFMICFAMINCKAQPNGGFENWSTSFNAQIPDDWQTLNFLTITTPPNPISVFKAAGLETHSGNFALKLKTIFISNNPIPQVLDDTMGLTFTGKINISAASYRYGFPHAGRPEKLNFWYKYAPVGNDTAGVRVLLRKWNGVKSDTIGFGEALITSSPSYTLFQCPITYFSDVLPDTATIFFASSKHRNVARVGSTLYVDDVAFSGYVGVDEKDAFSNKVTVFPNPAKDNTTIRVQLEEADNIEVTDISGRLVAGYKIRDSEVNVKTDLLPDGTYLYNVKDKTNKILVNGKFNVIR